MEIRVLNYFLMVAREENITKAANLLHLTQPTLSRQMIQLEEELGVTLFHRSKHRIVLTEDGMLLRRRATEIVALADKTKNDFQHRQERLSGTVAIGRFVRRAVNHAGARACAERTAQLVWPLCGIPAYHRYRKPAL